MKDRIPAANGLANLLMVIGLALLVFGGASAYPSIRAWLGLDVVPKSFGDEKALSAGIIQANEALPRRGSDPATPAANVPSAASPSDDPAAAPIVLPETPLQTDVEPAPTATAPPPQPTPTRSTPPAGKFVPGAPTRLVIPAIGLDAPVEPVGWSNVKQDGQLVSMWNVPNRFAAGWLNTSAPAGERGNTVLDGHHNIAGEVFRYVVDLKPGDTIQMWVGNQAREYVVSLRKILPEKGQPLEVRLDNAKWIQPTSDERLTLVTCWPYTNNTHRLIVVALPADAPSRDNGVQ